MTRKVRSVFISDVHLGTKQSQAGALFDFLSDLDTEYLYLVGDIIDYWKLKSGGWSWSTTHNEVVRKVIKMANGGTKVFYIPGNHDELLREYIPINFGNISIQEDAVHKMADGKTYVLFHGDAFDKIIVSNKWVGIVGSHLYEILLNVNRWFNKIRRMFGLPYWSLSLYLKHKAKEAVNMMDNFKQTCLTFAHKEGYDGVICGHIHKCEIISGDTMFVNCGDWVESLTAIIEHHDGKLEQYHHVHSEDNHA